MCKYCRSRRELSNESPFLNLLSELDSYSNEYLLAKFGFDTAENEPFQVCPLSAYRSPRRSVAQSEVLPASDAGAGARRGARGEVPESGRRLG